MSAENKLGQQRDGLQSPERRRFLGNAAKVTARLAGLGLTVYGGADLAVFIPNKSADIALRAKEKSPQATREEIKREIRDDISKRGTRALLALST